MKTHSLSKRFLSLFLCIVFCFSLLPTAAFADDAGDTAETQEEAGVIVLEGTEDPAEEVIVTEPSTEADSSTETALTEEEELPEELEFAELERIQRPGDAEIQGRNDVATVAYADGVGYESYTSLEAAIAAAGTEFDGALLGSTIQLAMDVTQDWLVLSGKTVVLDLNGKTLTADIDAYAGDYTITNGTVNGTVYANGLDSGETGHLTIASDATIEADYANEQDDALLEAYYGRPATVEEKKRFIAAKLYVDYLWTLWGLTRVPFDGDFMQDYADGRYLRLKKNIEAYQKLG